ncbi:hypothetical protein TRIATDRAFT_88018 [Trichoderma atroviride IMI 206040]|uniref:Uncharacterized protein n=1 Tax=Hypocrea atroviridis (strain ATCC 20476 / IMI 206040) TaxID=452589 RepID=G9NVQ7_HYPAI|nr:uncharacterized protein TRIATDRAFT_88018 [Trichoderma atroviride IMI 206040]EHK45075.1 hypothetical protein TRIATDRAFT_88018 [Trichoderma atroviride IMI 206040]
MNRNEALRARGGCSVWGCEEPIFAESLCSKHQTVGHNAAFKPPGAEPMPRSVHKAKRTRRFSPGRTTIGPAQSNLQRSTPSAYRNDSTLAHPANATEVPASAFARQFPKQNPSHVLAHPASPATTRPVMTKQVRAATEFLPAAYAVTTRSALSEPREPYFALRPDQGHSAHVHQSRNRDAPAGQYAPPNTLPRKHLALIGGLVDVEEGLTPTLNLPNPPPTAFSISSSIVTGINGPPTATSSSRAGDTSSEESSSITVAQPPSRRKPEPINNNRREGPTIHVFQKSDQILQSKENIPIHISPLKRKADLSDTLPKIKDSLVQQKGDGRSTLLEKERQTKARNSNYQEAIYGSAPPTKSSKCQSHVPSSEQAANQPRTPRKVQIPNTLVSTIETVQTNDRGQLENHTRVQIEILDSDDETIIDIPQQPQQPKPLAAATKDAQKNMACPASTIGTDGFIVVDQTVVDHTVLVATQAIAEERNKDKARVFDSDAFDAMIYRQSTLRPPPGVASQAPARPKTPVKKPPVEYRRQYLPINPAIHLPIKRSEEWHTKKALEIQARGRRKAWFGKVIERRRWLRAKEKAEEDERSAAKEPNQKPLRIDPQPWSYNRVIDFGDVPHEELPEDVLQNPAWAKACAWHRENHAKRIFRERAAKNANRAAWDQAERVMEDAKLALQKSRGP